MIHCAMSNRSAISPASARAAASPRQAPAFDAAVSRDRSTDEQRRLGARELGGRIEELVDVAVGKLLRQAVDAPRRFVNRAGDRRRLTLQFQCCAVDCARETADRRDAAPSALCRCWKARGPRPQTAPPADGPRPQPSARSPSTPSRARRVPVRRRRRSPASADRNAGLQRSVGNSRRPRALRRELRLQFQRQVEKATRFVRKLTARLGWLKVRSPRGRPSPLHRRFRARRTSIAGGLLRVCLRSPFCCAPGASRA